MSNQLIADGNVGNTPELRYVKVGQDKRAVLEFRVAVDNHVQIADNEWEERGTFWVKAVLWGKKAERAAKLLVKGSRVHVVGRLILESWVDKDSGEERQGLCLQAEDVYFSPIRIDSIQYTERKSQANEQAAA